MKERKLGEGGGDEGRKKRVVWKEGMKTEDEKKRLR